MTNLRYIERPSSSTNLKNYLPRRRLHHRQSEMWGILALPSSLSQIVKATTTKAISRSNNQVPTTAVTVVQFTQRQTKAEEFTKSRLDGALVPPDISPRRRAHDIKLVSHLKMVLDGPISSSSPGWSMLNLESDRQSYRHSH